MWGIGLENSKCSKGGKPVAIENFEFMVMSPEVSTRNQTSLGTVSSKLQKNLKAGDVPHECLLKVERRAGDAFKV